MKEQIKHHANEIIRLIDEDTVKPDPDPIEEEDPPVEEEEPVEENPDNPISNFKCELLALDNIKCSWIPNKDGEMDIEFNRPGIDKRQWQHSVEKYVAPIPISDGQVFIGIGEFNTVVLRAKIKKTLLGIPVGNWYSDEITLSVDDLIKKPEPKPEPIPDPPPTDPDPVEDEEPAPKPDPEPTNTVDLLIYFVNKNFEPGKYIDVNVDGIWYNLSLYNHDSPEWDVRYQGARGVVLMLPKPFKHISFRDEQIFFDGFENNGVGLFSYKIGAKPLAEYDLNGNLIKESFDLYNPVSAPEDHPNFWARWFNIYNYNADGSIKDIKEQYADLISGGGSLSKLPTAKINSYEIPENWSNTGKLALILGGVGVDAPG